MKETLKSSLTVKKVWSNYADDNFLHAFGSNLKKIKTHLS